MYELGDGKKRKRTFLGKAAMNDFFKYEPDITSYEWESELEVEPLSHVLSTVKSAIRNIVKATKADDYKLYLSDKTNFREDIATVAKYKGNRDDKRKPVHHKDVIKYLKSNCDAIIEPNLEADDLLARDQTDDTVIASIDKDLLQIPGKHYNFVQDKKLYVSPEKGRRKIYEQMLTGDRTDNIPGIYKMGPVTANKILDMEETEETYENAVKDAWHEYLCKASVEKEVPWLHYYDPDSQQMEWHHWSGTGIVEGTLDDFLDEIRALVTIGVPDGTED